LFLLLFLTVCITYSFAQRSLSISGTVADRHSGEPIPFVAVYLGDDEKLVLTTLEGKFHIEGITTSSATLHFECLGYEKKTLHVDLSYGEATDLKIRLGEANLELREVTVTAQRKTQESSSSFLIDRTALDNQQILNLSDVTTLLPGGKTVNPSLINDTRISLHSGEAEKGNAAFGTAIEMDGIRMQNNASMGETTSASTRTINSTNIESVEIVTGIPSVEYGDLSNGIVKVKTRRGKTPWTINMAVNPHTYQMGASRGFSLRKGILNASWEYAHSFSDLASPHTAYKRNNLSLNYQQPFRLAGSPLYLNTGLSANLGGYNSESDPDAFADTYRKQRDYAFTGRIELDWQLDKPWISRLQYLASISYSDRRSESKSNESSSTTQPYLHGCDAGYFIATEYDSDPNAPVILGPTGYWYVKRYTDSKPLSYSMKLKAEQVSHLSDHTQNRVLAGLDWMGSGNEGRGTYYDDLRYAPSWREYRYDELPYLNNIAIYVEDKLTMPVGSISRFQLTAGLREDLTIISGSNYGTVGSLSPRFNGRLAVWQDKERFVRSLSFYGGWGKSVKLPSFEVLYPSPNYTDRLSFASTSTADGTAFYAYNIIPTQACYNKELKWQYTYQSEIGTDIDTRVAHITLSAYYNKTFRPYIATSLFSPYSYRFTDQTSLSGMTTPAEYRRYDIDRQNGFVSLTDIRDGSSQYLEGIERRTYNQNIKYVNGSPIERAGIDYIIDFKPIAALQTSFRLDGNFYHYYGVEHTLIASLPEGAQQSADGQPYPYIGYYEGTSAYGASSTAYATTANGSLTHQANLNLSIITHIPRIRLVIAMRLESSLYDYRRALSEGDADSRGIVLDSAEEYFGNPYESSVRDHYVAVYPRYYSSWENPEELIPFTEKLLWARDHDASLYNDLTKLVVKTNYAYNFNPDRISAYFSANLNITKEIGDFVSVSFLANNFLNSLQKVKSSRTELRTTIYNTGYISPFYFGLSLRIKL